MAERRLGKRQRQEAKDLVGFIDAHGGRLGAFRGYGASRPQRVERGGVAAPATSGPARLAVHTNTKGNSA
jgi:hypothetical protein